MITPEGRVPRVTRPVWQRVAVVTVGTIAALALVYVAGPFLALAVPLAIIFNVFGLRDRVAALPYLHWAQAHRGWFAVASFVAIGVVWSILTGSGGSNRPVQVPSAAAVPTSVVAVTSTPSASVAQPSTAIPPSSTSVPVLATLLPATSTPIPATSTPLPPAATAVPAPTDDPHTAERVGIRLTMNDSYRIGVLGTATQAGDGMVFHVFDVTITNLDYDSLPYNPLYFKVTDPDHFEYSPRIVAGSQTLKSGTLSKGGKTRGTVAFELPVAVTHFKVAFQPPVPPNVLGSLLGDGLPIVFDIGPN